MNFLILVKLKGTVSLEDMIVSSIKRVGRVPKAVELYEWNSRKEKH